MRRLLWGVLGLWLLGVRLASAQDTCGDIRVNQKGTSGASITVDATVGGVVVAEANTSRCKLTLINETANPLRCAPSGGKYPVTVTTTAGLYLPTGVYVVFGRAAKGEWKCIRSTGTSTTLSVAEELP